MWASRKMCTQAILNCAVTHVHIAYSHCYTIRAAHQYVTREFITRKNTFADVNRLLLTFDSESSLHSISLMRLLRSTFSFSSCLISFRTSIYRQPEFKTENTSTIRLSQDSEFSKLNQRQHTRGFRVLGKVTNVLFLHVLYSLLTCCSKLPVRGPKWPR